MTLRDSAREPDSQMGSKLIYSGRVWTAEYNGLVVRSPRRGVEFGVLNAE